MLTLHHPPAHARRVFASERLSLCHSESADLTDLRQLSCHAAGRVVRHWLHVIQVPDRVTVMLLQSVIPFAGMSAERSNGAVAGGGSDWCVLHGKSDAA